MNKRQKEVFEDSLENERQVLEKLEKNYEEALKEIREKIKLLQVDKLTQSKIYQLEYQKALEKQVTGILEMLKGNNFSTVQEYLEQCYETGFFGTLYDIHGQGIPLIFPIDQEEVARMIQKTHGDIKLSERLYSNVNSLKSDVISEISRGISNGYSWQQIAQSLAFYSDISINRALTIARTEGHRVQNESQMKTLNKAKEAGADVVKQWDSTLDGRTRQDHKILDGQIREVGEYFEIAGHKAMYPGGFGVAKEDINCRCGMIQRARWALDEVELEELKERAKFFGLDKTEELKDFKRKYLDAVESGDDSDIMKSGAVNGALTDKNDPLYVKRDKHAENYYKSVRNSKKENIVKTIASNTGILEKSIAKVYDHVFINEYELYGGRRRFDPDYDMAESFRRLRDGKDIQEHDLIMLRHERLEYGLMNKFGMSYDEAHKLAASKYNYKEALDAFKKKRDL